MQYAIELAKQAEQHGEVPVGAVIIDNISNEIIGEGWNCPISTNDPTAHAETRALRKAAASRQNYRLPDTIMYVTLEPCVMCAGAIFHARIGQVVFGAYDPKAGAAGSVINVFGNVRINHHTQIQGGVLEHDCAGLLKDFFKGRR